MAESFGSRLKKAWNVFLNRDSAEYAYRDYGPGYSENPSQYHARPAVDRTILNSIIKR